MWRQTIISIGASSLKQDKLSSQFGWDIVSNYNTAVFLELIIVMLKVYLMILKVSEEHKLGNLGGM